VVDKVARAAVPAIFASSWNSESFFCVIPSPFDFAQGRLRRGTPDLSERQPTHPNPGSIAIFDTRDRSVARAAVPAIFSLRPHAIQSAPGQLHFHQPKPRAQPKEKNPGSFIPSPRMGEGMKVRELIQRAS